MWAGRDLGEEDEEAGKTDNELSSMLGTQTLVPSDETAAPPKKP